MDVVIGGNRVGSGKKMHTDLNNYGRSNHNLNQVFASSMGPGILYPCLVIPAMRGDSFTININADCRTIPTKGPLFGSYKMQIDLYQCPVRLYQGILHNNPLGIGLKMNQVKLPKIRIWDFIEKDENGNITDNTGKIGNSTLHAYLGLRGIGQPTSGDRGDMFYRDVNAVPLLAYYDIFKNYYANKQEEEAYVITGEDSIEGYLGLSDNVSDSYTEYLDENEQLAKATIAAGTIDPNISVPIQVTPKAIPSTWRHIVLEYTELYSSELPDTEILDMYVALKMPYGTIITTIRDLLNNSNRITWQRTNKTIIIYPEVAAGDDQDTHVSSIWQYKGNDILGIAYANWKHVVKGEKVQLQPFNLSNIDDMRYELLSHHTLGSSYLIDENTPLPYYYNVGENYGQIKSPLNGLVLKTYQNDLFNNWLNAEWIEGPGSIADLTKISTAGNSFTIDAFNLSTKIYNILNRVVINGNTYEDWEDAVYTEVARRQIESPIFIGGMSKEIIFDEVIQTSAGEGEDVLGRLGGRGRAREGQKGGRINVKCDEACYIIGIVSLTPRIYYTQGNEFYITELDSLDDMHKPGLDGIGFQDLLGERLAWFDTKITSSNGVSVVSHRSKIGKVPAWIEYMTAVNKGYADFAGEDGTGYMLLQRNYEKDPDTGGIKDVTTYIDPTKYNYVFAYSSLESQNFWTQIAFNIKARRLMSARVIPNV